MGNALSDPLNMLNYGDYVYQTGLVDRRVRRQMKILEYLAKHHANDKYGKIVRKLAGTHLGFIKIIEKL